MRFIYSLSIALALLAGAARAEIGAELLAAYSFNGDGADISGRGQHAQLVGAEFTTDRFGNPRSALLLDGQGAYAATPVSGQRVPVSFSFWFRLDDRPGLRPYSIVDSGVGDSFGHAFVIGSGPQTFNANLVANCAFARGRWTHVAVSYGDHIRVFMDGHLVAEKPYKPASDLVAGNFQIGRHSGSDDARYFPGAIDDVLIFGRELTADCVQRLFEDGPGVEREIRLAADASARLTQAAQEAIASRIAATVATPKPILVVASSSQNDETSAWNAFDGDAETVWSGASGESAWWIAAEFYPPLRLSELDILYGDPGTTNVLPFFSMEADAWTHLLSALEEGPVTARFLLLTFPADNSGEAPSIKEVRWVEAETD